MPIARFLLFSILLLACACSTIAQEPQRPSYYVMRHLDRATGQDPGLTEEGQRKAQQLVAMFAADPPTAIYVSDTRRARETAAPLAAALGRSPITYDPTNTAALVAQVRNLPGPILIVGHSNTVPDIVEQLGGARPADIKEDEFGEVWHVSGSKRIVTSRRLGGS
jgi:broad specificity phosphatase PhoE